MKKVALVLSGGGSRGAYEIGVWKALKKLRIKIDMVMGTSVGAINSAMIVQGDLKLSQKLWRQLETEMVFDLDEEQQPPEQQPPERQTKEQPFEKNPLKDILHLKQKEKDTGPPENAEQFQKNVKKTGTLVNVIRSHKNVEQIGLPTNVMQLEEAPINCGSISLDKKLSKELKNIQLSLKEKLSTIDIGGMPAEDALIYAKEIVVSGGAGSGGLRGLLEEYIDEKKVRRSKIEYGLVTTEFPSLNGHFLYLEDIPQGKLIDYILASASCFPAVQKCLIDDKKFIDGGYKDNMPVEMALKKGATTIIAVDLQAAGFVRKDTVEQAKKDTEKFHLIKSSLALGNFLIFDKDNTFRIMTLGYLDTMRQFGRYDGEAFTFKKGQLTPHELLGAENAALILGAEATEIYTKNSFNAALREKLLAEKNVVNSIKDIKDIKKILAHLTANLSDVTLRVQVLLYIAESLKNEKENSPFLQPKLFKMLEREVQAANYLLQQRLL